MPKICPICGTYYESEGTTCKKCRGKRTRNLGQKLNEQMPSTFVTWQFVVFLLVAFGIFALIMWLLTPLTNVNIPI